MVGRMSCHLNAFISNDGDTFGVQWEELWQGNLYQPLA
jgi:hypothetical protein